MKLIPRTLLALLVLASCASASEQKNHNTLSLAKADPDELTEVPQILQILPDTRNSTSDIRVKFLDFIDYRASDVFEMGVGLRNDTLNDNTKTIILRISEALDFSKEQGRKASNTTGIKEGLDRFAKKGHDTSAISITEELAILIMQRFDTAAKVMIHGFFNGLELANMSFVMAAIEMRAFSLLRILQACHIWSSLEQFYSFQALSYKSEWYDPDLWQTNPMDWSRNLTSIFTADNPMLLSDILTKKIPLTLSGEGYFVSAATNQISPNIRQFPKLNSWFEGLVESEKMEILCPLIEFKALDNLHLEDLPFPKKLPKNFKFFWAQGYRYLPAYFLLEKACEQGRVDVLKFLYKLNLKPVAYYLKLAIDNGHLDVLNWALDHNLSVDDKKVAKALILSGHFEAFKQLEKKLKLCNGDIYNIANSAAKQDNINAVEWIQEKFGIAPKPKYYGNAGIEMVGRVKSTSPQTTTVVLAENASPSNFEWLSKNHPPTLGIKPTSRHANAAASGGNIKILELLYGIDPSCISGDALLNAVKYNNLETAKYLESILNLKGTVLSFDLLRAFESGNLELLERVYQYYKLGQPKNDWIQRAIRCGHLHIINWAIENQFISKTNSINLKIAAGSDQYLILQRLLEYSTITIDFTDLMKEAFSSGGLGVVKYLTQKDPKSVRFLKNRESDIFCYHKIQWLRDRKLWPFL